MDHLPEQPRVRNKGEAQKHSEVNRRGWLENEYEH